MDEEWRELPDLAGYKISSLGRIIGPTGKILRQSLDTRGYPKIGTHRGGKHKTHKVHQLVCRAFHGPRPEGHEVCHLDDVSTNNAASNLMWGTRATNVSHRAYGDGYKGEGNPCSRLTTEQVLQIRDAPHTRSIVRSLAAQFGVTVVTIRNIRSRKKWGHLP